MKETDLYKPVKDWLLDYVGCNEVYPEISDVDVLGIAGKTDIIVELKTRFSFKLLEQAEDRLQYAPYIYVAVLTLKQVDIVVQGRQDSLINGLNRQVSAFYM